MGTFKGWMSLDRNLLFAKFPNLTIGTDPRVKLLDFSPAALGAWSVRLLSSFYSGPCIKARRSSDNTTQDIYFVNGILDTASLLAFASGGNCFVEIFYDQSGNANDLIQSTLAAQPQIVDTGIIFTQNLLPSLRFTATPLFLSCSSFSYTNVQHSFISLVGSVMSTGINQLLLSTTSQSLQFQVASNTLNSYGGPSIYAGFPLTFSGPSLFSYLIDGTQTGNANRLKAFLNQSQRSLNFTGTFPALYSAGDITLGRNTSITFAYLNGHISEAVAWIDKPNIDFKAIQSNQTSYFRT